MNFSASLQDQDKAEGSVKHKQSNSLAPPSPYRDLIDGAAGSNSSDSDEELAVLRRRERSATALLSPLTYTSFKDHLEHIPEMNLPWQSMRSVHKCCCGTAFSFAIRKVGLSTCAGRVISVYV